MDGDWMLIGIGIGCGICVAVVVADSATVFCRWLPGSPGRLPALAPGLMLVPGFLSQGLAAVARVGPEDCLARAVPCRPGSAVCGVCVCGWVMCVAAGLWGPVWFMAFGGRSFHTASVGALGSLAAEGSALYTALGGQAAGGHVFL